MKCETLKNTALEKTVVCDCRYRYQEASVDAARKLQNPDYMTVDENAHAMGMQGGEPLIIMLDSMLRYALAYRQRCGSDLHDDGVLFDYWIEALDGIHGLLNGDGAIAMQKGITTDSKSNGACESVYWAARHAAGFPDNAVSL